MYTYIGFFCGSYFVYTGDMVSHHVLHAIQRTSFYMPNSENKINTERYLIGVQSTRLTSFRGMTAINPRPTSSYINRRDLIAVAHYGRHLALEGRCYQSSYDLFITLLSPLKLIRRWCGSFFTTLSRWKWCIAIANKRWISYLLSLSIAENHINLCISTQVQKAVEVGKWGHRLWSNTNAFFIWAMLSNWPYTNNFHTRYH